VVPRGSGGGLAAATAVCFEDRFEPLDEILGGAGRAIAAVPGGVLLQAGLELLLAAEPRPGVRVSHTSGHPELLQALPLSPAALGVIVEKRCFAACDRSGDVRYRRAALVRVLDHLPVAGPEPLPPEERVAVPELDAEPVIERQHEAPMLAPLEVLEAVLDGAVGGDPSGNLGLQFGIGDRDGGHGVR
jgi:hypothetical protein